jgi:hypothetical protein
MAFDISCIFSEPAGFEKTFLINNKANNKPNPLHNAEKAKTQSVDIIKNKKKMLTGLYTKKTKFSQFFSKIWGKMRNIFAVIVDILEGRGLQQLSKAG